MSMRGNRFAALGTETVAMPASGHSAARVPPDVLDALEEDLGPSNDGVAPAVGRLEVVSDVHVPRMAVGDRSERSCCSACCEHGR